MYVDASTQPATPVEDHEPEDKANGMPSLSSVMLCIFLATAPPPVSDYSLLLWYVAASYRRTSTTNRINKRNDRDSRGPTYYDDGRSQ